MCAMNFDPTTHGIAQSEWNKLTQTQQEEIKKDPAKAKSILANASKESIPKGADLSTGLSGTTDLNLVKNANTNSVLVSNSPAAASNVGTAKNMAGLGVEKTLENYVPGEKTNVIANPRIINDKGFQELRKEQHKQQILERYANNPAELDDDIAEYVYRKEYNQIAGGLEVLEKEDPVGIKDRYLREFATAEEVDSYNDAYASKLKFYKENPEAAKKDFNAEFGILKENDRVRVNKEMTEAEVDIIAKRKALIDEFSMGPQQFKKMAKQMIIDQHLNKAINKTNKYAEKIKAAEAKGDTATVTKLKTKAVQDMQKEKSKEVSERNKHTKEIAEAIAEAQIDREIAKAKFENTEVHWDKNANYDKKDGKDHNVLNEKLRGYIMERPGAFADEVANGKGDFTKNGKSYKFNSDKYKEYMLDMAAEVGDNDYYASIPDRKDIIRNKNKVKSHEFSNDPKLKDRKFAGEAFKTAGIDIERDKTVEKRLLHVGKSALKGAGVGAATAFLAEALSTTKVLNTKYQGIVQYAGTTGYSGMQAYKGTTDYSGTADYSGTTDYSGTADYSGTTDYSGTADYSGTKDYSGTANYSGTKDYSGTANYSGTKDYTDTGTVTNTDTYISERWDNGFKLGEQTTTVSKDIPWEHSGKVDYSGTVGYSGNVDYSGEIDYSGTVDYKGKVDYSGTTDYKGEIDYSGTADYKGKVDYSGETDYEGEVAYEGETEYEGEKEYSGNVRQRNKIDWNNIGKAAILGAIAGGVTGLATMKTVHDNGGSDYATARQKAAEKFEFTQQKIALHDIKVPKYETPKSDLLKMEFNTPSLNKTGEVKKAEVAKEIAPAAETKVVEKAKEVAPAAETKAVEKTKEVTPAAETKAVEETKEKEYFDFNLREVKNKAKAIGYKIEYGDNPTLIILSKYPNVKFKSPEFYAIRDAMYKESGYKRNTNLVVGDTMTLPSVEFNGRLFAPDEAASVRKGTVIDNGLAKGRLKKFEIKTTSSGFQVMDVSDPANPKAMTGVLSKKDAGDKMNDLIKKAEAEGKLRRE